MARQPRRMDIGTSATLQQKHKTFTAVIHCIKTIQLKYNNLQKITYFLYSTKARRGRWFVGEMQVYYHSNEN
jgi:hypothetical protein